MSLPNDQILDFDPTNVAADQAQLRGQKLDDFRRLKALQSLALLDSPPEEAFDRVTRLITRLLDVPVALVSLLDSDRQFFKSQVGVPEPWASRRETPLSHSFCQYVVTNGERLVIEDARENPLVADNLAIPDMNVIAYAGVPLRTTQGEILGSVCMIDSKPRQWSHDELNTLDDLMATLITELELRRRATELTEQNEDLRTFAHTVAHDLKAPISLITGYSNLLREDFNELSNTDRDEYLERIEAGGDKMVNIVNELLLLAEVRTADVKLTELNTAAIITEVKNRLAGMFAQHQPEFIAPSFWHTAYGYTAWVEEIWTNYISNALKYGGTPRRIEVGSTLQANGSVRFWVRDNGGGLTSDQQAALFKPFTRVTTNTHIDGHGLGLSIVRRIAEKLGGTAGVESELGKGSTFSFTLPTTPIKQP